MNPLVVLPIALSWIWIEIKYDILRKYPVTWIIQFICSGVITGYTLALFMLMLAWFVSMIPVSPGDEHSFDTEDHEGECLPGCMTTPGCC